MREWAEWMSIFRDGISRDSLQNGILRMVGDDGYAGSFGFEWNRHPRTQLDSHRNARDSETQLICKTGLTREEVSDRLVLDAGVGAGRYSDVLLRWGARVVGVDLSRAVDAAAENFPDRSQFLPVQASIDDLPFCEGTFDFIISVGVLHHTPDTRLYFEKLLSFLKPGGTIAIWVYPTDPEYLARIPWIPVVNRLPEIWFYNWCCWYVPLYHRHKSQRFMKYINRVFPVSDQNLGMENDILDTFDGYSPRYHWVHDPEEVRGWFEENGLLEVQQPSHWHTCMRGRKPI